MRQLRAKSQAIDGSANTPKPDNHTQADKIHGVALVILGVDQGYDCLG